MRSKFIYLHGFASSPASATVKSLKRNFPQYDWIFPELTHHSHETLSLINALIDKENPTAIIGTSLGGFYALYCKNQSNGNIVKKLCINPALYPSENLSPMLGKNTYFNQRIDGVTDFELTQKELDEFATIELPIETLKSKIQDAYCVYASHDELLNYTEENKQLFGNKAYEVDSIGHRLTDDFIKNEMNKYLKMVE